MNIVVCVKQVPDVDDIKWTKENNLDRTAMLSKINPQDEWALDWAIGIKSKFKEAKVTAISMGPIQAKEVLSRALAKGADRAILLSDKSFSGSDTLATSKILAKCIKKYIPDFHLILTGQMAIDGDTAQVPVSLAQLLDIPDTTGAIEIFNSDKNCTIVSHKIGNEIYIYEMTSPCLVSIKTECKDKINPKIEDYIRAQNTGVEVYNAQDLEFDKSEVGIIGSPTMVWRAFRPENNKNAQEITQDYSNHIAEFF